MMHELIELLYHRDRDDLRALPRHWSLDKENKIVTDWLKEKNNLIRNSYCKWGTAEFVPPEKILDIEKKTLVEKFKEEKLRITNTNFILLKDEDAERLARIAEEHHGK